MRRRIRILVLGVGVLAVGPWAPGRAAQPGAPACTKRTASPVDAPSPVERAFPGSLSSAACCVAPNVEPRGTATLRIDDMVNAAVAGQVRRTLRTLPGIRRVDIRMKYAVAALKFDERRFKVEAALAALETAGLAAYRVPPCCEIPPR